MSRLRELKLHGFKTFADPTRFVFERGVTAVIGPNGSGKSNMADAVRWVLGEQSNRSLRTRRADDVIFAGSQGRRPQGMAEAILTLDNSDHWLPIDFEEVSIGRRAFRSGETEYLINGTRARLKEVVELLAGGRLGANELVVVGQGTVDGALSLRPEERRQLFEEAAGVKNLQVRKNEALGRLARARDNLTRIGDLVTELKPQVRRLALQAQHQQEHDALGRRALALVIEAHRRREVTAREALGEARRRMAAAEASVEALRAHEAAGQNAITEAEGRYWSAEAAARAVAERREASREALIRAEAQADAASRRHADLASLVERTDGELASAQLALAGDMEAADPVADMKRDAAREAEGAWRAAAEDLELVERELLSAEQALATARDLAGAELAEAARRDEASARAGARIERVEGEVQAAGAAVAEATAAVSSLRPGLVAAEAAEAESVDRSAAARLALTDAEAQAAAARARATALAERVGGLRAELDMLHERLEGGAQLGSTLAAAGWQALMDDIDPPQDAWAAIETLVGGELQQALVWREADLVDHAAGARGSARLLMDGGAIDQRVEPRGRDAAFAAVHATRTLSEWIGSERGPLLFARTAIAPDLPSLLEGWRSLPPGWCAVTIEGDLADERGLVVVRGREERSAGEAARQHARRRELSETLKQLEAEHEEAGQAAAQALVAASAARTDGEMAKQLEADAERRGAEARAAHGRAADALARAQETERLLNAELDQAHAMAGPSTASPSVSAMPPELDDLAAAVSDARQRHALLAAQRDAQRQAWHEARAAADATDAGETGGRYERAVVAARRDQLLAVAAANRESVTAVESELAATASVLAAAVAADQLAAQERLAADAERDQLRASLLESERARGGATSRLADLERQVQAAAIDAQRLEDELIAIGRERDLAIESLPPPAEGLDPASPGDPASTAIDSAAALETIEAELGRVRRTLSQIGSVNPFAIEEHRGLAARLQELGGQDEDLNAAIASTEELIERLESEIAGQFNAAFAAIGAKFDEFCRLLFAGGSASLQMSEASDGEAAGGIEIAVRPPGKRLQRLAMLSGGERALAGVALLFAMLSVNPVPFCILDEVDAALDEANIGRFADALRKLAETIDFVVITHNRATIETADTIYGVTMTDAAVSRVLSLRLADVPAEVIAG